MKKPRYVQIGFVGDLPDPSNCVRLFEPRVWRSWICQRKDLLRHGGRRTTVRSKYHPFYFRVPWFAERRLTDADGGLQR